MMTEAKILKEIKDNRISLISMVLGHIMISTLFMTQEYSTWIIYTEWIIATAIIYRIYKDVTYWRKTLVDFKTKEAEYAKIDSEVKVYQSCTISNEGASTTFLRYLLEKYPAKNVSIFNWQKVLEGTNIIYDEREYDIKLELDGYPVYINIRTPSDTYFLVRNNMIPTVKITSTSNLLEVDSSFKFNLLYANKYDIDLLLTCIDDAKQRFLDSTHVHKISNKL